MAGIHERLAKGDDRVENTVAAVQQRFPFGRLGNAKIHTLQVKGIHPVIRIAHRIRGPLRIASRIIRDHEFVLILRGGGRIVFGAKSGGTLNFGRSSLLFIEPFVPHEIHCDGSDIEHIAVHFDWAEDVPAPAGGLAGRRPYAVRLAQDLAVPRISRASRGDGIEAHFVHLLAAFRGAGPIGSLEATTYLTQIILQLLKGVTHAARAGENGPRNEGRAHQLNYQRIARAIEHARAHFAESLSPDALAGIAGLSPSRFAHVFRAFMGIAPMDFVRRLRVEEARKLLADVDLSVKQIAGLVGFEDAHHFSRVFRVIDGLSPSEFREALLASRAS